MTALRQRWAVSFADLTMLLLGFFVLLHARGVDPQVMAASTRAALGGPDAQPALLDRRAASLFEPGEARLTAAAARDLAALARPLARGTGKVRVESSGREMSARRFDRWELAAARTAAIARALQQGGVAEQRISVSMPDTVDVEGAGPHRLTIRATS